MDFLRYNLIPYGPFLEEWKPITEIQNNKYEISNYGRVRNFKLSGYKVLKLYIRDSRVIFRLKTKENKKSIFG